MPVVRSSRSDIASLGLLGLKTVSQKETQFFPPSYSSTAQHWLLRAPLVKHCPSSNLRERSHMLTEIKLVVICEEMGKCDATKKLAWHGGTYV